jgi:hypothetical protein
MLHWIKVAFLVLLVLITMRVLSWMPMWIIGRTTTFLRWKSVLFSNAVALFLFFLFLKSQALPGEYFDTAAAVFGLVVFLVYSLIDFFWLPWKYGRRG